MGAFYGADLARIHDSGFGHIARAAAPVLLAALREAGIDGGLIVDLGCGSGIASEIFAQAGYDVLGIDLSPDILALARARVPGAEFRAGSFADVEIPPCVAVAGIGEIFGYCADERNSDDVREQLFTRIHVALAPRGVLLFDLAGPARAPAGMAKSFVEGEGWTVLVETSVQGARLTRRIVSFIEEGAQQPTRYRRDVEAHLLDLVEPAQAVRLLTGIGYAVTPLEAYGALTLPPGLHGYLARKS